MVSPISSPLQTGPVPPAEVGRSLLWWRIAMGLALLIDVIGLIIRPKTAVASPITSALAPGSLSTFVLALIELVIWFALVYYTSKGSNAARWTLTVVAVIEELIVLAGMVFFVASGSLAGALGGVMLLVEFVPALLGLIYLHKPGARIYFQRRY